jgi:glycosyltransferase involved in cell wall biosynthesis
VRSGKPASTRRLGDPKSATQVGSATRILMLRKGWFPGEFGGLDRYYRELLEHLPSAQGVVVGPAEDASARVSAVSRHSAPLPGRLLSFMLASRRAGQTADVGFIGADSRAPLLIAGDGYVRTELEDEIAARSLRESVTLLGRVSDEELVALYQAANVNVVPSASFEGFGLVVLEAAGCGTPSIVTRVGGLPEAVAGLGEELTVPAADADGLADRIARAKLGDAALA